MRILNITETYAPFFEFGGPPVKVHALAQRLAKLDGNQVAVLTADWGIEKRLPALPVEIRAERSPFGWRLTEDSVQSIYLHSWLRYRTLTWNPAIKRYCRARLSNFDVVHIFGLYDLFGPAVADFCRRAGAPALPAEVRAALTWSTHQMLSYGITSYTEASVGFVAGSATELHAYAVLADAGALKQRATLCLTWAPGSAEAESAIAARNRYARARVAPDCVKIFLDGVPTDGHTAAMLEPYTGTLAGRDDDAAGGV